MKIEQIYTGCLAEAAYYIESNGEAAIIDPLREVAPYIQKAKENGARIKYILETHFHADFVSGHVDLARETGATIVYGPGSKAGFDFHQAKDGELLPLGDINIQVLHTPGHTQESTTFLLKDEMGKDHAIFSGDTLFIGDVGRPDLAVKSDLSKEDLAGMLFDSLRTKIMPLADEIIVYPGHGAGSACGKNMSKETFDTLGHQKEVNYALRAEMSKEAFIKEVTTGILPPPQYFPKNALLNKTGAEATFDQVLQRGRAALDVQGLEQLTQQGDVLILDVRSPEAFAAGHIPNSIFIGLDGNFAPWVGALITDLKQAIVLVAPKGKEEEAVTRLARVGYDNTIGFLEGGFSSWLAAGKEVSFVKTTSAEKLAKTIEKTPAPVIDVRKSTEYQSEHVIDALNIPLTQLNEQMRTIDKDKSAYVHCAGGYRSMIAISILQARGYHELINVNGGFDAIRETSIPVTEYVCPSTL